MIKPNNRPAGVGNAFPLARFAGLLHRKASHEIFGCLTASYKFRSLATPQFGGAAKGKRLNGQARRLTSPHLVVLCRTSTGAE